jgi:hypothetical protein
MSNINNIINQISNLESRIKSLETSVSSMGAVMQNAEGKIASAFKGGQTTIDQFTGNISRGAQQAGTAMEVFGSRATGAIQVFKTQVTQAIGPVVNLGNNIRNAATIAETNMTRLATASSRGAVSINELGIAGSRVVPSIQQLSGSLSQMNAGTQQVSTGLARVTTSMNQTQTSAGRLAELFRGNRGLVFGFSALFGTLTGIAFELQLVNDANAQVAESQGKLNQLVAEGKQGSQQYSQAQQALAKDQRFLEFSTRNLALAFTNLIPDVLLIINGMLSLRDKIGGVTGSSGLPALARSASAARTEVTALGGALAVAGAEMKAFQATSATPLGKFGIGGAGAGGLGAITGAGGLLSGLTSILAIAGPIALAIGGIVAVITLLISKAKEMDQKMLESSGLLKNSAATVDQQVSAFAKSTIASFDQQSASAKLFETNHSGATQTVLDNLSKIDTAAKNTQVVPTPYNGPTGPAETFPDFNKSYSGLNPPSKDAFVNDSGQWVDKSGKVLGSYGANINVPGGTKPQGNYPGGAYGTPQQKMKPYPSSVGFDFWGAFGNVPPPPDYTKPSTAPIEPQTLTYDQRRRMEIAAGGYNSYEQADRDVRIRAGLYNPSAIGTLATGGPYSGLVIGPSTTRTQIPGGGGNAYAAVPSSIESFQSIYNQAATAGVTAALNGYIDLGQAGKYNLGQGALPSGQQMQELGSLRLQMENALTPDKKGVITEDNINKAYAAYQKIRTVIADINKTGLDKINKDNEMAAEAAKKLAAAQEGANKYIQQQPRIYQETGQMIQTATQERQKEINSLTTAAAAYVDYEGTQTDAAHITAQQEGLLKAIVAQGNQVVGGLYEQRDAVQANVIFWERMNETTKQQIAQTQEEIFASIDVTQALTNQTAHVYLLNQGYIQGALNAKAFIETTIQGAAANQQYNDSLLPVIENIDILGGDKLGDILPAGIKLSNDELNKLFQAAQDGTGVLSALADIVSTHLAPAFETLNGVIGAESKKDFNKAFKEFDFGKMKNQGVGDFKDMDKTLNSIAKQGQIAVDVISHLRVGLEGDFLKGSTFRQGFDAISESLKKIQDLDPRAKILDPLIAFFDSLNSKDQRRSAVALLGEDLQALFEKIASGQATAYDYLAFQEKLNNLTAGGSKSTEDMSKQLAEESKQLQKVSDWADKNGRKVVTLLAGIRTLDTKDVTSKEIGQAMQSVLDMGQHDTTDLSSKSRVPDTRVPRKPDLLGLPIPPGVDTSRLTTKVEDKGTDPKAAATTQQVAANNQLDRTIKQLIIDTNLMTKANNLYDSTVAQVTTDVNLWLKANNLFDRAVRQIIIDTRLMTIANNLYDSTVAQIITDLGLWVKANNLFDRTVRQLIIDTRLWVVANNVLDVTVAQLITDVGLWIKTNNILDKTIAQIITDTGLWTKGNNLLDRTVAQLITDVGIMIKTNNTYARTLVQVANDTDDLAKSTKSLTSSLSKLESQAIQTAKALIAEAAAAKKAAAAKGGGGGGGSSSGDKAQHGMHKTLTEDTVILAHAGEQVDIDDPLKAGSHVRGSRRGGTSGVGEIIINLTEHNHIEVNGQEIEVQTNRKTFRRLNSR